MTMMGTATHTHGPVADPVMQKLKYSEYVGAGLERVFHIVSSAGLPKGGKPLHPGLLNAGGHVATGLQSP